MPTPEFRSLTLSKKTNRNPDGGNAVCRLSFNPRTAYRRSNPNSRLL
jgi:hypothetical protein